MDSAFGQPDEDHPSETVAGSSYLAEQAERRRLLREDFDATIRVCPSCLKNQFGSLRDLQNAFKAEASDLEAKFLDWAATPFQARRGSHHNPWHMEVVVEGFRVLGPRYTLDIQALLYAVNPDLVTKEKRFKNDYAVPEAIKARLRAMGFDELFRNDNSGGRYQPFTPQEVIKERAAGNLHAGSYKRMSLAELQFGQSVWQQTYFQNDTHALVKFYSGWRQFNALLTLAKSEYGKLRMSGNSDQKSLRFAWDVFGEYLILMGRDDIISILDRRFGDHVPGFAVEDALQSKKLDTQSSALMLGDLAVISFLAEGSPPLPIVFPETRNIPDLMRRLEAIDYPRLNASADDDLNQRLEAIGRAIARRMDRAMVVMVNWRPLFNALRGSPPKKSR